MIGPGARIPAIDRLKTLYSPSTLTPPRGAPARLGIPGLVSLIFIRLISVLILPAPPCGFNNRETCKAIVLLDNRGKTPAFRFFAPKTVPIPTIFTFHHTLPLLVRVSLAGISPTFALYGNDSYIALPSFLSDQLRLDAAT